MGVRIVFDQPNDDAVLYDSVTMTAFGPVFDGNAETGKDARECAESFLAWLAHHHVRDARQYSGDELRELVHEWRGAGDRFGWEHHPDGRLVEVTP